MPGIQRDLIGKRLVRQEGDRRIAGMIVETEAYRGEEDLACHCRAGETPRTKIMYGPPGRAYVYFVYGMHWLLNFVTEKEGYPGAVLIRGILPEEGLDLINKRRNGRPQKQLFIEENMDIPTRLIQKTPRIGLDSVPEPWRSKPWRFIVTDLNSIRSSA